MTIYVFVGPSIRRDDAQKLLDAHYLPPAAQGDVLRVAQERPYAIGIVDGYFQRVPSVWHKEILWAMAQGIRVYGSASMGALRAAELASFGMVGVGWVFEAFHSGVLEDDDEVAIAHADEEHGFRPTSEAMVNIRCTLNRAAQEGVISERGAEQLAAISKQLYYPERSYPRVLADAERYGVCALELQKLREWLPSGAVNQKRNDALAMLRMMKAHAEECRTPLEVRYAFEHTAAWEAARSSVRRTDGAAPAPHSVKRSDNDQAVIEELKLSGSFARACRAATARALALEVSRQVDRKMEGAVLHESIVEFRRERGLEQDEVFEQWLEAQEIASLDFFKDEALVRAVSRVYQQEALRLLPDQLRSTGEYGRLLDRARHKERALTDLPAGAARDPDGAELVAWYFQRHLRRSVPDDLSVYLRELGVASLAEFMSTLSREYQYARALEGKRSLESK